MEGVKPDLVVLHFAKPTHISEGMLAHRPSFIASTFVSLKFFDPLFSSFLKKC